MRYEVKTLRDGDAVVALTLDAADVQDARNQASQQGYAVLSVRALGGLHFSLGSRRAKFPLLLFSQELLALLDAGLSLMEALQALAVKETRPDTRKVLEQVIAGLYEGRSLSAALERFPSAFPALYVATVRASERSSGLPEALSRYIDYQSQLDLVRKKLVSASIYPVLLISVGLLVTLFLMVYVVPKFSKIYQDVGTNLPFMSRLLIKWGNLLETNGAFLAIAFAGIVAAGIYWLRHPATRTWIASMLWLIPQLGERMKIYQLARFYRTLGMLLRAGIPIVTAMEMAAGLLPPVLQAPLGGAALNIKEGRSISHAMEANELTTPVALRMLLVGERTGKMGELMDRIATFYDNEMARWVEWFTRLFEPLLMIIIGLIIGLIVILLYMPIFELAGSIQ
ncbi:MAG: type II secretion system F family protein [Gammaproteobacteria bacterium]|nr:type II secretion system F family protein [Gammaproteobacteria bacterium]